MRLRDKVAVVTGGGGAVSIGRCICLRFAEEGARVAVVDIDEAGAKRVAEEIRQLGGEAIAIGCDVTDESQTESMAAAVGAAWGRVDILVNNAAVYKGLAFRPFDEWTVPEWDHLMAVNVKGPWLCAKAVVSYMREQKKGKIINISSSSFMLGVPGFPHYVASKAAVIGLTRSLAKELGKDGIRVTTLAPGYTLTEASLDANKDNLEWNDVMKSLQSIQERNEMPEDLCGPALFLASDDSDFMTGSLLLVDGGAALW